MVCRGHIVAEALEPCCVLIYILLSLPHVVAQLPIGSILCGARRSVSALQIEIAPFGESAAIFWREVETGFISK